MSDLERSQAGVSGSPSTMMKGRRGINAPGRQVRRQASSQPSMYISRLPVLAAAGIRMVRVPRSSGVEISRTRFNFSRTAPLH